MQRDMEYRLTFGEKQLLSMELGVKISIYKNVFPIYAVSRDKDFLLTFFLDSKLTIISHRDFKPLSDDLKLSTGLGESRTLTFASSLAQRTFELSVGSSKKWWKFYQCPIYPANHQHSKDGYFLRLYALSIILALHTVSSSYIFLEIAKFWKVLSRFAFFRTNSEI